MVRDTFAELRRQHPLGQRHADRGGNALAERPGRRLDAGRHEVLGMARGLRIELAEAAQLVRAHALDTDQV
jgi:hypothetical protein